jgi:hypothetical protein
MSRQDLQNNHIEGKTYTLYVNSDSSDAYYLLIRKLADQVLEKTPDIIRVMKNLRKYSSRKRFLRHIIKKPVQGSWISDCLNTIDPELKQFTQATDEHLKYLSFFNIWDRRLSTTREQYHLYMLEIELTNRLFLDEFKKSDSKVALLPYCLQDFAVKCKAAPDDFDYQCRHCSSKCYQNYTSAILKKKNIEPYIWMSANLKHLAKKTFLNNQSLGVLGIACIPELVWGMRKCRKYKIPVVGIPLNANRCKRWFGEFHQNSVNLEELEKLIS